MILQENHQQLLSGNKGGLIMIELEDSKKNLTQFKQKLESLGDSL